MKFYIAPVVALFAANAYASNAYAAAHLRREQFDDAPAPKFGYVGEDGPVKWGNLDPTFGLCSNGTRQSPINIDDTIIIDSGSGYSLTIPDIPGGATLENVGTTIQVELENSSIEFGGKVYQLKQFHFHSPGEHLFDGRNYVLEAQFRGFAEDGSLANIGVPIALSDTNYPPVFGNVLAAAANVTEPGSITTTCPLTFVKFISLLETTNVYRYTGSYTSPPCTEGVEWVVLNQTATVDYQTFLAAKNALKFNARFPQNELGAPNLLDNSQLAFART
ncbi:hypothetical protein B7463_g7585, partial [Scytalidium lignicola]